MLRFPDIVDQVLSYHPNADTETVERAYIFSAQVHDGQVRLSGEPYLSHPLEVANILANMKMDVATIAAGLLHDTVEDTKTTLEEIKSLFGDEIANLVDGVTKISLMSFASKHERQAENIRKMILAMANDIRVILIKLADRLHNMLTLGFQSPEKQRSIAQETLDIYAPLAGRLGMGERKAQLEDLSFFYLEPEAYKKIKEGIAQNSARMDSYIKEVKGIIIKAMEEHGLKCVISGRHKHLYSIHKKMLAQNIYLNQVYDLIAFRLRFETVKECYEALGVVHSLWKPIPGRFKDYIGIPKANMYQSLHTTVVGPYAERMEMQIRTEEMHRVNEQGIAAHWRYKDGRGMTEADGQRFAWLRQLLEWQQEVKDPQEFLDSVRVDLFPEEVYVFTPKGEVKQFPRGATPIDFAYAIHSEVGQHVIGAKVHGRMVPLKYELKNGDMVEVLTSLNQTPSKDWLKIIKTTKARNRIRNWIKSQERQKSVALGKEICEKEFRSHNLSLSKLLKTDELLSLAKELSYVTVEDLLAAVGYGKITARQLVGRLVPKEEPAAKSNVVGLLFDKMVRKITKKGKDAVTVKGVDNMLIRHGNCCRPLPGEDIVGFITRGRGVTIHKKGCSSLSYVERDRLIEVTWDLDKGEMFPVQLQVMAQRDKSLLTIIGAALGNSEANVREADMHATDDNKVMIKLFIEVLDLKHLENVFNELKKNKKIISVKRVVE
ncbi:MAG: bifunctional (p)ppGpp synthetase/guanosine-3',5'-bis(diphosphate) 3'-pyrophosphohydrolase [Deltaproteobacteria bacterium]|nr:bifunctional (p)ppGpp synthetase/guanosine-3',5'-bis(diphosphate) 3'-pyrophosphohydrolase [Deltaproteobacteria bacterium]